MPDVSTFLGRPASVLDFLIAFGVAMTAVAALWKAPFIRKPTAYVARKLVGEPITAWFRKLLSDEATRVIKKELKEPNGGSSIPDLSTQITDVGNRIVSESIYTHREIHRLNGLLDIMWPAFAKEHDLDPAMRPAPQPSPTEENDE